MATLIGHGNAIGVTQDRFEIYRADEIRTSSARFLGGDWRWRLCDETGRALVDAGGYRSEAACRAAVALLKDRAGSAVVTANA